MCTVGQILGELSIFLGEVGDITLEEVKDDPRFTFLCSDVGILQPVDVYSSLMSNHSTLIHLGDFVRYSDTSSLMVCGSCYSETFLSDVMPRLSHVTMVYCWPVSTTTRNVPPTALYVPWRRWTSMVNTFTMTMIARF